MKAFILDKYNTTAPLRFGEMPEPEIRDDEVLIKVHAAGINMLDTKIKNGEFKFILPYRLPLILGHDVAGVVVRVGPRVHRFKMGDEVYSRPDDFHIGAFAEFSYKRRFISTQAADTHYGRSCFHSTGWFDCLAGIDRKGES